MKSLSIMNNLDNEKNPICIVLNLNDDTYKLIDLIVWKVFEFLATDKYTEINGNTIIAKVFGDERFKERILSLLYLNLWHKGILTNQFEKEGIWYLNFKNDTI